MALGLGAEDYVLIYVAEIIANKNQQMLLDAFEQVRKTVPNAKLVLVGPEHDDGALRKMVESKGLQQEVLLLGWRSDVPMLLHLADVYVASSKSEGLGLNLIEAMACDIPVIATKNRGHAEIIQHEKNGFLVEQNEYEGMADYVLKLYEDTNVRMVITGQAGQDILKYDTTAAIREIVESIIHHA
jgi:glycosyltransferase EpsD